mmetsp:Transcript_69005/g.179336  ORF Transcript_69005/g.179336 Transcript_69005/m.179336 type:complete len:88 (-) Transcript_69005:31-294(-)
MAMSPEVISDQSYILRCAKFSFKDMSLEELFKSWEEDQELPPDVLAELYALLKQAAVGDSPAEAPEGESERARCGGEGHGPVHHVQL